MAFKLIDEALHNRLLRNFEAWCERNNKDIRCEVTEMLSTFRSMKENEYTNSSNKQFCEVISTHIVQLLNELREECRKISPTFLVWDEYLTKVSTPLKLLLTSTRSPNWSVHQHAKLHLMPLLLASNRTSYAKYMTVQSKGQDRFESIIAKEQHEDKVESKQNKKATETKIRTH
ncbi:hypothetical protein DPMN_181379 [Dreissena polymorpha]|uniref:Uncharacterized protein n=1 Tax=Dreissena polymorpha TaxID=45954 RepID=A0A9D4DG50_DREPO|nr:hypothetical protein DPMN_181379 [Dreissena polymorpha]